MKALVVYESMWGNTERVAEAIADGLRRVDGGDAGRGELRRRSNQNRMWS